MFAAALTPSVSESLLPKTSSQSWESCSMLNKLLPGFVDAPPVPSLDGAAAVDAPFDFPAAAGCLDIASRGAHPNLAFSFEPSSAKFAGAAIVPCSSASFSHMLCESPPPPNTNDRDAPPRTLGSKKRRTRRIFAR